MATRANLASGLDSYLQYLEKDRRVTPATLKNYRSTLKRFVQEHRQLTDTSVKAFLRLYPNPASANTALVRLGGLADFLDCSLTKVTRAKENVKLTEALSSQELHSLVCESRKIDSNLGHAVALLGTTGLRLHEFQSLEKSMLRLSGDVPYLLIFGKGRKERAVPLGHDALAAFQNMVMPFPIYEKRFRVLLTEAGKAAKLAVHVHPHLLRATCASILLNEKGVDSLHVAAMLGHSKIDTLRKHYYKADIGVMARSSVTL